MTTAEQLSYQAENLTQRRVSFAYYYLTTPTRIFIHAHSYYEILVFASGSVDRYIIGQRSYVLRPGDVLVVPPSVLHHPIFNSDPDGHYSRYSYCVTAEHMTALQKASNADYLFRRCEEQAEYLIRLPELQRRQLLVQMEKTWGDVSSAKFSSGLFTHAHFLHFLAQLNEYVYSNNEMLKFSEFTHDSLLERLLAYIHDNYSTDMTLRSTAKAFHVSSSTIEALFSKSLNTSFYRYVTEYRIAAAKTFILNGMPLKEVCASCGYTDYSNFYRVFTKLTGHSPSSFRHGDFPK